MAHHRKLASNTTGDVKENAAGKKPAAALSLPNIANLIADGEITVGEKSPLGCVAIAHDGHNTLAMLRRRRGETLVQLLTRLDQAIAKALTEEVFTDEINPPSANSNRS